MFGRKSKMDKCDCCQHTGFAKRKFKPLALCKDVDACMDRTYAS